jgi:outer membrane protein assembly factor BamB
MSRKFLWCFALTLSCSSAIAEDWSRFRGPNGSGISESKLPVSWTPTDNVEWKSELPGAGVSSPIVVGDLLFVTCYSGYGLDRAKPGDIENLKRHLVCIDTKTGKKKWQKDIPTVLPEDPYSGIGVTAHGYASHTPVSDGKNVYAFFGKSGAYAFDLQGNQLWQANLGKESDPRAWGSSSSPILYEDLLIVTASAESQAIVGLDKKTGKEVWRQEAAGLDDTWSTPALVKIDDKRTDLVLSVPKEMWGLNPMNGKLVWYSDATGADQTHSSAIAFGDTVVAFTGRGGGSVAVRAGGKGNVTASNVLWTGRDSDRFASPVAYKSNIYLVAGGTITQIDAKTGEKKTQLRLTGGQPGGGGGFGGADYGSPVIAGDKLYYTKGTGDTFVFQVGDELKQLSVNLVTTDKETFAGTPAVSNGKLYIRSDKNLYCIANIKENLEPNASSSLIAKSDDAAGGDDRPRGGFGGGFGGGGGGGPGGRGGFDPAAIFKDRDKNSDGKLTQEEVAGTPMADRFADIDKDKDQGITLEEFRASMQGFGGGRGGPGGGRGGFGGRGEDKRPKRQQRPAGDA